MGHPTLGRRGRHKSPPSLQSTPALPAPRLADHLDTEIGPSDEESGKEAKGQKSDYSYLFFQQTPKWVWWGYGNHSSGPKGSRKVRRGVGFWVPWRGWRAIRHKQTGTRAYVLFSHGGYGSSSLQECLDLLNQTRSNSLAPCHSRFKTGKTWYIWPAAGYEPKCGRRTDRCQWTGFRFCVRRPTAAKRRAAVSKERRYKGWRSDSEIGTGGSGN